MQYTIIYNGKHDYTINGNIISEEKKEEVGYGIIEPEYFIDDLIDWIGESEQFSSDRFLMKEDLQYLMTLSDEYIFSSLSTNEYITFSDDEKNFNRIANELLS